MYAIHNMTCIIFVNQPVVLSGFQRYFCMQYTTYSLSEGLSLCCFIRISKILLYAIHNSTPREARKSMLFYQDFKDTFVCNTQLYGKKLGQNWGCFIRISKILLYAIHNTGGLYPPPHDVVLSGFQRYFCMQYTTVQQRHGTKVGLFYQDFKDTFVCNTQHRLGTRL